MTLSRYQSGSGRSTVTPRILAFRDGAPWPSSTGRLCPANHLRPQILVGPAAKPRALQVLARSVAAFFGAGLAEALRRDDLAAGGAGQCAAAHLLQLRARGHLLGEQRGLDAVEETFEPAHELCLGDAQFCLGRDAVAEGQGEPFELVAQLRSEAFFELVNRQIVDLAQPLTAGFVERSGPNFF